MLYLDSALASDAATATDLGFVAGVTTNPKLMAAAVEPPVVTLAELCDRGPGVVFYQVTADDVAGREKEAHDVHTVRPGRVGIKIPCTVENLAMAVRLRRDGIGPIGITAVFTPAQAVLAAAVGADFVLPYVNRLTRLTGDGLAVVAGDGESVAGIEHRNPSREREDRGGGRPDVAGRCATPDAGPGPHRGHGRVHSFPCCDRGVRAGDPVTPQPRAYGTTASSAKAVARPGRKWGRIVFKKLLEQLTLRALLYEYHPHMLQRSAKSSRPPNPPISGAHVGLTCSQVSDYQQLETCPRLRDRAHERSSR